MTIIRLYSVHQPISAKQPKIRTQPTAHTSISYSRRVPIIIALMKQFKTDIYEDLPPFACCLYHKEIKPWDENFLDMIRFTFFPYFQLYSFTFFWIATVVFVYFYSLYMQEKSMPPEQEGEFMRVSQSVLFELGENYPYYIVKKYHYYRLFTSAVLFRNLYHFLVSAIGILIFGSYIEELVGFKRIFLLTVTSGVGGELLRNVFIFSASIESLTPICGLIGYLCGLYLAHCDSNWKYNQKEKYHMMLVISMVVLPYVQLGASYANISLISMGAGLVIGFVFYFCDPLEKFMKYRVPAIIFLVGMIATAIFCVFFRTHPQLLSLS